MENFRTQAFRGTVPLMLFVLWGCLHGAEAATIQVRADIILASNQGTGTDDRLGAVAKQLTDDFKYSRYEIIATPGGTAQVGQAWQTALPGGRTLEVTPTTLSQGTYHVQVRVLGSKGEAVMKSNVVLRPGRPVLIGGPSHPPGILIIALSAS